MGPRRGAGQAQQGMKPLSHHEILSVIEPFARQQLQVDLAGSDRPGRRLLFRPLVLAATDALPALTLQFELQCPEGGDFRLIRHLLPEAGPAATLTAAGADPGELLAEMRAIPAGRQYVRGNGYLASLAHAIEPGSGDPDGRLRFTRGVARFERFELDVTLRKSRVPVPADVTVRALSGGFEVPRDRLPQDLLAVLGWPWTRLVARGDAWRGELRLRGRGLRRSRLAEAALHSAAAHLALTFAEPPARFHERLLAARWRVAGRRAVPLLLSVLLTAGTAAMPQLGLAADAALRVLLLMAALLGLLLLCIPEMPRIEFPPLPRRPEGASWQGTGRDTA
jgi:hypothetical protein